MPALTAEIADRLRSVVPPDRVLTDSESLAPYAFDASFWSLRRNAVPDVVVLPETAAEVQAVVRLAAETGTPIVARGAGTGQTGGAVAARGGIVLSLARMNRILEVDRPNLQAVVEPGVVLATLQAALHPQGLFFPPDPGSSDSCTLGGMVANNASGPHAVRWGTTSVYVLGLELVLADGSLIQTGGVHSKALKSSSGLDLTRLFVGSEGTLGIATRLRLRVQPRPPARAILLPAYPSLEQTVASLDDLFAVGVLPGTAELLDRTALAALRQRWPGIALPEGEAVLVIELDGATTDELDARLLQVGEVLGRRATTVAVAQGEAAVERIWEARRGLAPATAMAHPGKTRIYAGEDLVVALSRVPEAVRRTYALGTQHEIAVTCYGHLGDGNVHTALLIDPTDPAEVERADRLTHHLHELALELGGSVTGEHGTGIVRAAYMQAEHGAALAVMRTIKDALDPQGILNPGKIWAA